MNTFNVGDKVMVNGFEAVVSKVYGNGLYDFKLSTGTVCNDGSYVTKL